MKRARVALSSALLTVLMTSACSDQPSRALTTLQRQQIVTARIPATTDSQIDDHDGGTALGKPVRASLTRTLTVAPGHTLIEVQARVVRIAESDGWITTTASPEFATTQLAKQDASMRLQLSVSHGYGKSANRVLLILQVG